MRFIIVVFSLLPGLAVAPASAEPKKHKVEFVIQRSESLGSVLGWSGRKIIVDQSDRSTIQCDDESGLDGKAACWITCDPSPGPSRTYVITLQDHSDYDRRPFSKLKFSVSGCDVRIEPASATIVYVHVGVLIASVKAQLDQFVADNPGYAAVASTAAEGVQKLFRVSIEELGKGGGFERITKFQALSRELSALHKRNGEDTLASFYSSAATATANALVTDIGRQLKVNSHTVWTAAPGTLNAYYKNLGTINRLVAEKYGTTPPGHVDATTKLIRALKDQQLNALQFEKINRAWTGLNDVKG